MSRNRKLVPILAAATVAATACGGTAGNPQSTPSASGSLNSQQIAALYRRATECARDNGMPSLPYPTQNPQSGEWDWPDNTPDPPPSVRQACRSIINQIDALGKERGEGPPTAADLAKLKRWAKCVRDHGLAYWPDPNADGTFTMPESQVPKRKPAAQFQACKQYAPARGIRIAKEGSGDG
jgi:hypothetical protein